MGPTSFFGFPTDLLEEWSDVVTTVGVMESNGQTITYEAVKEALFETASCLIHCLIGPEKYRQRWTWLYTDDQVAGFMLVQCDAYLLDQEEDVWRVSFPLPHDTYSVTKVGAFSSVNHPVGDPLIMMFAAEWADIPEDERNP